MVGSLTLRNGITLDLGRLQRVSRVTHVEIHVMDIWAVRAPGPNGLRAITRDYDKTCRVSIKV